jgi:hypothetical protein
MSAHDGLSIKDGAEVECGGRRFITTQLIGFDFVVARDIETDDMVRLAVVDPQPRLASGLQPYRRCRISRR